MLTVVMATYNGSGTLAPVLEAYRKLQPPRGGWKLVIVDNGSTDQTREAIAPFRKWLPLEYVWEPQKGKNKALNAGLETIAGDLVVFADDDLVPQPEWLSQLRNAADCHPQFSIFGGCIVPKWQVPPERWILEWAPLSVTYGITSPAWEDGPIAFGYVFGANMAIRASIFQAGYRFDPSFGPGNANYPMGSETELLCRLSDAGHKAWHCRNAVAEHIIRATQMNKAWVFSRAIRYGRGQARLEMMRSPLLGSLLGGIPTQIIREILSQVIKVGIAEVRRNAEALFKEGWQLRYLVGRAIESRAAYEGVHSGD